VYPCQLQQLKVRHYLLLFLVVFSYFFTNGQEKVTLSWEGKLIKKELVKDEKG